LSSTGTPPDPPVLPDVEGTVKLSMSECRVCGARSPWIQPGADGSYDYSWSHTHSHPWFACRISVP